jgi:sugar phosphate isomerase/epimerase
MMSEKCFHFGLCEWSLPVSGPLAIQLAGEIGYEGMQLGEAGGRQMGYPLNQKRVQEIYREAGERHHVLFHSLNLGALLGEGTLNFGENTKEGQWARESLRNGFAVCGALGIGTVVITVDPPDEDAFSNVVSHLAYASAQAAEWGVNIALESAQSLPAIERLLERISLDIGICMDLLNPLRFQTGNPQEQIKAFGAERINHFHAKDSVRELFQMGQRGCTLLGEGDAGFCKSADIIKSMDFDHVWMITENYYYLPPMNRENGDFCALAKKDLETMREVFGA